MAKSSKVMKQLKRKGRQAQAVAKKVNLTLGELIAAAFDTVGAEARSVARVLSSDDMSRALNRRIVCG